MFYGVRTLIHSKNLTNEIIYATLFIISFASYEICELNYLGSKGEVFIPAEYPVETIPPVYKKNQVQSQRLASENLKARKEFFKKYKLDEIKMINKLLYNPTI